jgi:hypothetical protein
MRRFKRARLQLEVKETGLSEEELGRFERARLQPCRNQLQDELALATERLSSFSIGAAL